MQQGRHRVKAAVEDDQLGPLLARSLPETALEIKTIIDQYSVYCQSLHSHCTDIDGDVNRYEDKGASGRTDRQINRLHCNHSNKTFELILYRR